VQPPSVVRRFLRVAALLALACPAAAPAGTFVPPAGLSEIERQRFARFESFQIKGVCNDTDLERLATLGVNTVRGYKIASVPATLATLDRAHRLGMRVVVSEWMPHQGPNKNRDGSSWDFDYTARGDKLVTDFIATVEGIGDHPALLMWGLGNEVHLDEPYLRVANRMSQAIHERFPHHLTSLTVVNVKDEAIAAIKRFAPDIDVLGVQSYSVGAVRNAIKRAETLWGKPFYMSEFNGNGPWNFRKTDWGVALDEPVTEKVADLRTCYAAIDASSLCLGSTVFLWGHATNDRPTYFSLLLDADPNGPPKGASFDRLMTTPQAEVMIEHFTGRPPTGNRAPVLSALEFDGGLTSRLAAAGEPMTLRFQARDPDDDPVTFTSWILDATARKTARVAGPFAQTSDRHAVVPAPTAPGSYLLMVYATDGRGGASASTLPFKVPAADAPAP